MAAVTGMDVAAMEMVRVGSMGVESAMAGAAREEKAKAVILKS